MRRGGEDVKAILLATMSLALRRASPFLLLLAACTTDRSSRDSAAVARTEPEARDQLGDARTTRAPDGAGVVADVPEVAPDMSQIKLIDYDFKKFGSSEERTRLLSKWDAEIGG